MGFNEIGWHFIIIVKKEDEFASARLESRVACGALAGFSLMDYFQWQITKLFIQTGVTSVGRRLVHNDDLQRWNRLLA